MGQGRAIIRGSMRRFLGGLMLAWVEWSLTALLVTAATASASVSPTSGLPGGKLVATWSAPPTSTAPCSTFYPKPITWTFGSVAWAVSPVPSGTTACTSSTNPTAPPSIKGPGTYQVCGMEAAIPPMTLCANYTILSPPPPSPTSTSNPTPPPAATSKSTPTSTPPPTSAVTPTLSAAPPASLSRTSTPPPLPGVGQGHAQPAVCGPALLSAAATTRSEVFMDAVTYRDTPLTVGAVAVGVASVLLLGLRLVSGSPTSPRPLPGRHRFGDVILNRGVVPDDSLWSWFKHRFGDIPIKRGVVPNNSLWSWFTHTGTITALGASAVLLALTGAGSAASQNGLLGQCAAGAALPLSGGVALGLLGLIGGVVLRPYDQVHRLRRGRGSLEGANADSIPSGGTTTSPHGSGTTFEPRADSEVALSFEEGQPDAPIPLSGQPSPLAEPLTATPPKPSITPSEVKETPGRVNLYAPVAPAMGGHAHLTESDSAGVGGFPTYQGNTVAPPGVDLPNPIVQSEAYVQRLTHLLRSFEAGATVVRNEIVATVGDPRVIGTPDQLNTEDQLRLQLAMDRRSKFEETISNILKKVDETASSIAQNLK